MAVDKMTANKMAVDELFYLLIFYLQIRYLGILLEEMFYPTAADTFVPRFRPTTVKTLSQ